MDKLIARTVHVVHPPSTLLFGPLAPEPYTLAPNLDPEHRTPDFKIAKLDLELETQNPEP